MREWGAGVEAWDAKRGNKEPLLGLVRCHKILDFKKELRSCVTTWSCLASYCLTHRRVETVFHFPLTLTVREGKAGRSFGCKNEGRNRCSWVLFLNFNDPEGKFPFENVYPSSNLFWHVRCLFVVWLFWVGKQMFAEAGRTHLFPLLSLTIWKWPGVWPWGSIPHGMSVSWQAICARTERQFAFSLVSTHT